MVCTRAAPRTGRPRGTAPTAGPRRRSGRAAGRPRRRQVQRLVGQPGQQGDAAARAGGGVAQHGRPPVVTGRPAEGLGTQRQVVGAGADGPPVGVALVDTGGADLQVDRLPLVAGGSLEVLVEPRTGAAPGGVRQTEQAGELLARMVARAQLQALGHGQPLVEGGDLTGVEEAVAPGVGQQDGGAVGVDPVQVARRGAGVGPADDLGQVAVGEEVVQHPRDLGAAAAGRGLDPGEHRGRLDVPGLPAVQRVGQVGPAAQRGDGLDPRVEGRAEQGEAAAQREPHHADPPRVGRGPGERPVDHRGDVGHVLGPGDVDLAAGAPEAPHGVGDGDVPRGGERVALGDVLQVVLPPAGRLHHQRVAPLRVGARGAGGRGEHVGLEHDAVLRRDVGQPERTAGERGHGRVRRGGRRRSGPRDGGPAERERRHEDGARRPASAAGVGSFHHVLHLRSNHAAAESLRADGDSEEVMISHITGQ